MTQDRRLPAAPAPHAGSCEVRGNAACAAPPLQYWNTKNNTKYKGSCTKKYKGFFKKNTPKTHPKTNFSAPAAPKNLGGAPAARPQFPPFRRLRRRKGGVRLWRTPISFIFSWVRACGAPSSSFFPLGQPQKNKSSFLVWTHVFGDVHFLILSGGGGLGQI